MKIEVPAGKYVLAVSGGVDSMVLLDILANSQKPKANSLELIVAHFNHGIRPDSAADEKLVAKAAKKYGLDYEVGYGELGTITSEEKARTARYNFLKFVKTQHAATAIITAHHQDDLIETAILNMLRGTGPRGLSSIAENQQVLRPLLAVSKKDIVSYAEKGSIKWREDSTNYDSAHTRNYIRRHLMPKLSKQQRQEIIAIAEKVANINSQSNQLIATISHDVNVDDQINRRKLTMLPPEVAKELIMNWLRHKNIRQYDRKMIEKLYLAIKTAKANTATAVSEDMELVIKTHAASFEDGN